MRGTAAALRQVGHGPFEKIAETRDRAGDLQIFSLTLSQLSYRGSAVRLQGKGQRVPITVTWDRPRIKTLRYKPWQGRDQEMEAKDPLELF